MNTLTKTKKIITTEKIAYALLLACIFILAAMRALSILTVTDLLTTLTLTVLPAAAVIFLRHKGPAQYIFIPSILISAVISYVAVALISGDAFTWLSDTNVWLQYLGLACFLALFLFLYALTGRPVPTIIGGSVISMVFGITNCVMMQFRGRLFLVGDLAAVRTAANVAGSYSLEISTVFVLALILEALGCLTAVFLVLGIKPRPSIKRRLISRSASLVVAVIYTLCMLNSSVFESCGIRLTWNQNDFEESPVLYFVESIREMNVEKPDGYSDAGLDEIAANTESTVSTEEVQPNIIVVMSEAFSDLGQISKFETSKEITPFIDSLTENTLRGYVYSSVYGGNTANSEFEFLTGCSMAFIPNGSVPYQKYIKYDKDTLVSVLESQGYTTEVLHPYDASGWNRVAVYDCFGFDHVHFIEDFQDKKYLRGYVSDKSDYENLISQYEEQKDDGPLFLFNITMQNHGSYKTESYQSTVSITGHEGEFPQAEQYLSLLRETDQATEDLISYFSGQDEPVIILFFGDHQPDLEDEFYDLLYGKTEDELTLEEKQRKYITPFFIWANYDIEEADIGKTSINYLSSLLLDTAGLESSQFEEFLSQLQKSWPVITANGYVDASGEHLYADSETVTDSTDLQNYRILQYNYLFDTDGYRKDLFALK